MTTKSDNEAAVRAERTTGTNESEAQRLERIGKGRRRYEPGLRAEKLTAPEYDRLPLDERGAYIKDNAGFWVLRDQLDTLGQAEYELLDEKERENFTFDSRTSNWRRNPELTGAEKASAEVERQKLYPGETDAQRTARERRDSAAVRSGETQAQRSEREARERNLPPAQRVASDHQSDIDRSRADRDSRRAP